MVTKVLSGTYQGVLTAIEIATFLLADDSTVIDWATLVSSPAGGAWSAPVTLPASGGPYYHILRPANDHSQTLSLKSKPFSVGYAGAFGGQSNMWRTWGATIQGTPGAANSLTWRFDGAGQNAWYLPSLSRQSDEPSTLNGGVFGSNGDIGFANVAQPLFNAPIGMIDVAVSQTIIERWLTAANGGVLADGVTPGEGDCWVNAKAILAKAGVTPQWWFIHHGEGNASIGTVKGVALDAAGSQWYDILGVFEAQLNAQFGNAVKFIIMPIHKDASGTPENCHAVYQASARYIRDNASGRVYWGGHCKAFPCNYDTDTHFSAAQYGGTLSPLRAVALAKAFGLDTYGADGPEITAVSASAAGQTVDLTVTLHGGTGLADSNGVTTGAALTGFRCFVNGVAKTISATAFIAGPKIRLTLAGGSFVAGDTIVPGYLELKPNVTNPVFDNNAMPATNYVAYPYPGRPLRPTLDGILSCAAGA